MKQGDKVRAIRDTKTQHPNPNKLNKGFERVILRVCGDGERIYFKQDGRGSFPITDFELVQDISDGTTTTMTLNQEPQYEIY